MAGKGVKTSQTQHIVVFISAKLGQARLLNQLILIPDTGWISLNYEEI
jgi:hypothetical protein